MTDDISKVVREKPKPSYAPVYAAALYPQLATIARRHGYALAAHGSLQRDFDLIGIPWVEQPSEPEAVIAEFTSTFAIREVGGPPSDKPHGRRTWSLSIGFAECAIDLSFMPHRLESATTPAEVDAPEDGAYLIQYDDPSQSPELFVGHGAHDAAHHRYAQISDSWNAHLFAKIASNSRDCTVPNYAATLARQLAEAKAKCAVTLGVGSGSGSLFVHGDYDSIKAAQNFIFRAEQAESQLAEATTKYTELEAMYVQQGLNMAEATRRLEEVEGLLRECRAAMPMHELGPRIDAALQKEPDNGSPS